MSKKSDDYYKLIEPIWDQINIYDGPDVFLKTYSATKQPAGLLYAAHFAQSEICNGGFKQLFGNSTGVLSQEAVEGFQLIGMNRTAALVAAAMEALGSPFPRDRNERQRRLKDIPKDLLNQLDRKFFEEIEKENGGFLASSDAFVERLED
jgi:Domain of unknown function (DUF4375)